MTADQALERAKAALRIQDVWMRQSNSWMAEEFDPKFSDDDRVGVQHKHVIARATFAQITNGEQQVPYLYRVYIDFGIRLVALIGDAEPASETAVDAFPVLANIEATLVAEYTTEEDPGADALDAFAARNASYHAWPFWREYVVSQCDRMRLPRVVIPTMHLAPTAPRSQQGNAR
jgi:hypothetical protein